jgi:hypothetical protein
MGHVFTLGGNSFLPDFSSFQGVVAGLQRTTRIALELGNCTWSPMQFYRQ